MKFTDRFLQGWRIRKAAPFIPRAARVLDVGSADGVLFQRLAGKISGGVGIDPTLKKAVVLGSVQLLPGFFPHDLTASGPFDAITMLAVLEHFPESEFPVLAKGCADFLRPGGRLIITVPSPLVDHILKVLVAIRLVDGMSLEEHHGFEVEQTLGIFAPPTFRLIKHGRFQIGLNNLFVFQRV